MLSNKTTKLKLLTLLLVASAILSFIIRILPAISGTVHFGFDQGLDVIMVKQLVADHKINLVSRYSGLQGVLMGPLWTWFLAIPFVISQGNPAGNEVFLSLFAVTCSIITFFILKRILGTVVAVSTTMAILFTPFFVASSQVVLSPHPLTYIFIFYLWFLYKIFYNGKNKYLLPLGLLIGIFFQFEIAFAIFSLPPLVLFFLVFYKKINRNGLARSLILGGCLLFLTFIPQIVFDLRHDLLMSRSLLSFAGGGENSLYKVSAPLLTRFGQRALSFWDDFGKMALPGDGQLFSLSVVLLSLIGWWQALSKRAEKEVFFFKTLLIIILAYYVGFSFYPGAIWGWYRQGLPIVYVLLLTIPFSFLWQKVRIARPAFFLFGLVYIFQAINPLGIYQSLTSPYVGDAGTLKNQKEAIDQIYASAKNAPFSYYAYTPPVYDYIWQYDFWWYGQKKFGYLPRNWQMGVPLLGIGTQATPPTNNEGLFFLIIEPDSTRPWAPEGWLKSFIKIGTVEKRQHFPSGIIVERRTTT